MIQVVHLLLATAIEEALPGLDRATKKEAAADCRRSGLAVRNAVASTDRNRTGLTKASFISFHA